MIFTKILMRLSNIWILAIILLNICVMIKIITKFIVFKLKLYVFIIYGEDKEYKKSKGVIKYKV